MTTKAELHAMVDKLHDRGGDNAHYFLCVGEHTEESVTLEITSDFCFTALSSLAHHLGQRVIRELFSPGETLQ